jgi:hypothetical protein
MLTIDPGVHHYAIAQWRDGRLVSAEYIDEEPLDHGALLLHLRAASQDLVIVEMPKVYDAQFQKGDQRDIRDLALAAGGLVVAARFANGIPGEHVPVETIEPREWKGTVDKKVMLARIWDKLANEEKEGVQLTMTKIEQGVRAGKGPGADVLDAIGIGLWHVGRLNKGRTR